MTHIDKTPLDAPYCIACGMTPISIDHGRIGHSDSVVAYGRVNGDQTCVEFDGRALCRYANGRCVNMNLDPRRFDLIDALRAAGIVPLAVE